MYASFDVLIILIYFELKVNLTAHTWSSSKQIIFNTVGNCSKRQFIVLT